MSLAATSSLRSADEQARLDAEALLRHPGATVSVVGDRPWFKRALARFVGPATALLLYAAALTPTQLGLGGVAVGASAAIAAGQQQPAGDLLGLKGATPMLMSPVPLKPLFGLELTAPTSNVAPFDVPATMTPQQIALKLYDLGKPFQALAVTIEGLETKPYRDGCGLNVGMGYCIDARVRENGVARVRQDLTGAGLTGQQVDILLGNDRTAQAGVALSRTQALSLLALTEGDYRMRARDLVGQKTFDALPAHRQAALTWLSYNTGEGLAGFGQLLTAVRQNRTSDAVTHMTPFFSQGGQMVPNARAGSWLMAAYWSADAMKAALSRPDALESGARNGQSPLEVVAPHEAGRLALQGALPESPYVKYGLAQLDRATLQTAQVAMVEPAATAPGAVDEVVLPASAQQWRQQRAAAPTVPAAESPAPPATDGGLGLDVGDLMENLPEAAAEPPPRRPGMRR